MFPTVISALMHFNWFTITETIWALAQVLFYYADTLLVDLGGKNKLTQKLLYLLAFTEGHTKTCCSGALQCWAAFCMCPESGWRRNRYVFGKSRNCQCHQQFQFTKAKTLMGFKFSQPSIEITYYPPLTDIPNLSFSGNTKQDHLYPSKELLCHSHLMLWW